MQKKLNPVEASTSMGGEGSLEDSSGSGGGGKGGSQPKTAEEMIKIGLDAFIIQKQSSQRVQGFICDSFFCLGCTKKHTQHKSKQKERQQHCP